MPGDDDHAPDEPPLAQIDHPDGFVDVEVVDDGAGAEGGLEAPVHSEARGAVVPAGPGVALVVHPGLALEGDVLHCGREERERENVIRAVFRVGTRCCALHEEREETIRAVFRVGTRCSPLWKREVNKDMYTRRRRDVSLYRS